MFGKTLRIVLILAIIVVLLGLVVEQLQLRALHAEQTRLEKLVGKLDVGDPERVHIALVESSEPLHLLWRVYLPANTTWRSAHASVPGSSGWNQTGPGEARNELYRWRAVESQGSFTSHLLSSSGSATNSIDAKTAAFLRANWERLDIQVAGQDGLESASVEQVVPLLTIRVPDELMPTVREELGEYTWSELKEHPLLAIELGSEAAFTARETKLREEQAGE